MRPIKFRAWDKLKNRMLKVQSVAFSDSGEVTSIYTYGADFSNDKQVLMGEKPDLDSAVLEQYTGLKDSNGLEIYEGGLMPVCQVQGFYIGNIIKYMTRYQSKNGVEDLEKASTYLQQLIDFEKRLDSSKPVYHGQAGDIGDN